MHDLAIFAHVWILHKKLPDHADSGRQIFHLDSFRGRLKGRCKVYCKCDSCHGLSLFSLCFRIEMIKEAMRLRANCEREELLGPFWCVNLRSIRWTVAPIVEAGESFPPVPNGTRENQLLLDCGEENTHRETGWLQCFGTQSKYFELTMHTPVCTIIQRASRRVFRQTFATNSGSYKT